WLAFGDGVWATAFNLRALMAAGISSEEPNVVRAVHWLLESQVQRPQSRQNNPRPDAPRTGAWALQRTDASLPDVDDTPVVVGALGLVRDQTPKTPQAAPILGATRDAVAWVLGMQNRDGGWGAFVCDMPERPSGPFMTSPLAIDVTDPAALAALFFEP